VQKIQKTTKQILHKLQNILQIIPETTRRLIENNYRKYRQTTKILQQLQQIQTTTKK